MKRCYKCSITKELDLFHKCSRSKSGRQSMCIVCKTAHSKKYREANKDYVNERARITSRKPERKLKKYLYSKKYRIDNRPREYARGHNRRKLIRQAKLSGNWVKEIEYIYAKAREMTRITGVSHHVDHIVPVQGSNVCGLHVPWNLQVITAEENYAKSNRV